MKRIARLIAIPPKALALALILAAAGYTSLRISLGAPDQLPPPEPTVQILVQYKPNANLAALRDKFAEVSADEAGEIKSFRVKVLKVPQSQRDLIIAALRNHPQVQIAEADQIWQADVTTPNDPEYAQQWAWPKIGMNQVWDKARGDGSVTVAVLDSGMTTNHPDLAGISVPGHDYVNNDNNPAADHNHGTMVAGTIAALTNNGLGVAGGCWNCKIMPVKVLNDKGSGPTSNIMKGIEFAANNGAKIINLSLGGSGSSATFQSAIDQARAKGVMIVASSGNDKSSGPYFPSDYNGVISVAATDQNDQLTTYSNFSAKVELAAPGQIRTTAWPGTGYTTANGTSFSAPIVSAVLAVLKSRFPQATPADLTTAITSTADTCCAGKIGGGRINAAKALASLEAKFPPTDTVKPTVSLTAPVQGATISGSAVAVAATASDNVAVSRVEMQVGNATPVTDTTAPYGFTWNTTAVADGQHSLKVTAFDAAGNSATSTVTVTVSNGQAGKPGDLNTDGKVNVTDLSILLSNWGRAGVAADLNKSGKVDIADLSVLLTNWTK